jgi:hypothetical protein
VGIVAFSEFARRRALESTLKRACHRVLSVLSSSAASG